jgi:hypothetical protein
MVAGSSTASSLTAPTPRISIGGRLRALLLRPELTAFVSVIAVFVFFAITAGVRGT